METGGTARWSGTGNPDSSRGHMFRSCKAVRVVPRAPLSSAPSCPSTNFLSSFPTVKAKALYSYAGGNADELPFVEGDELTIVDQSEADWWKVEQEGVIFIVPAAYVELG